MQHFHSKIASLVTSSHYVGKGYVIYFILTCVHLKRLFSQGGDQKGFLIFVVLNTHYTALWKVCKKASDLSKKYLLKHVLSYSNYQKGTSIMIKRALWKRAIVTEFATNRFCWCTYLYWRYSDTLLPTNKVTDKCRIPNM